jgi:hypothetical protein
LRHGERPVFQRKYEVTHLWVNLASDRSCIFVLVGLILYQRRLWLMHNVPELRKWKWWRRVVLLPKIDIEAEKVEIHT